MKISGLANQNFGMSREELFHFFIFPGGQVHSE